MTLVRPIKIKIESSRGAAKLHPNLLRVFEFIFSFRSRTTVQSSGTSYRSYVFIFCPVRAIVKENIMAAPSPVSGSSGDIPAESAEIVLRFSNMRGDVTAAAVPIEPGGTKIDIEKAKAALGKLGLVEHSRH